jgi:hypothetical protein
MDDYRLGWEDPVAQLNSLRVAVKHLGNVRVGPRERFDRATRPLIRNRYVPERLKYRYENILNARRTVREDYPKGNTLFRFDLLSLRERRALADDIFALYEACLLDAGRMYGMGGHGTLGYEIMYPKHAALRTVKPLNDLPPQRVKPPPIDPSRKRAREPQYALPDDPEDEGFAARR